MITPAYIRSATAYITNADMSVAETRYKAPTIPTVARVTHELGRAKMEAALKAQLVTVNLVANAARPMTEDVLDAMVPVVLDHILSLDIDVNMADFRIIFDRAMRGQYGKFFGGIGCQDICAWFSAYEQEKMDAIDRYEEKIKSADLSGRRSAVDDAAMMHAAMVEWMQGKGGQE